MSTNAAFRALGISRLPKLPSRNWLIFWTVVSLGAGGAVYDRLEQRKIVNRFTDQLKPLAQQRMETDVLPRKLTVLVAPPPSDYLETTLKVWRRFVKPLLYYAGLDYEVFEEERQGMIRTYVAENLRQWRRQFVEEKNVIEGATHAPVHIPGVPLDPNLDFRDVVGIFYHRKKPEKIVCEDSLVDPPFSGGVICLGRGAYKEYIAGIHEGLLGPLDPPNVPKSEPSKVLDKIEQIEDIKEEVMIDEPAVDDDRKANLTNKETTEVVTEDKSEAPTPDVEDKRVLARHIEPQDYQTAKLPGKLPNEFGRDAQGRPILLHQPLTVIPIPNLIGFFTIPQKIYRFYTRREYVESVCEQISGLVKQKDIQVFDYPRDLNLALNEEEDWPEKWVAKGREKNSEWTQPVIADSRVTSMLFICGPHAEGDSNTTQDLTKSDVDIKDSN